MKLPEIRGTIRRRVLVNYRVDPEVVARVLPAPFEPLVTHGWTISGICFIRLGGVRPRWVPAGLGFGSENAAHRFAVVRVQEGVREEGVYIPRRDTDSCFNVVAGGRLFPGEHGHGRFSCVDELGRVGVSFRTRDGGSSAGVLGRPSERFPEDSIFASLAEASAFAEKGSMGWSARRRPGSYDTLELQCRCWEARPLEVLSLHSSFFDDRTRFPEGSVEFDHALLMTDIDHSWHAGERVRAC